jgi:hypothetical protein
MATTPELRQQVSEFRARLDAMLAQQHDIGAARRFHIDTTGNRSRDAGFRSDEARLVHYAQRRYSSIARICALLAIVRDAGNLAQRVPPVEVTTRGAYWQAFVGTEDHNACHSCPCLLLLDGQWPTLITDNPGLRRHIVVEFADCMLMPRSINGIDKIVDERLGAGAFALAAAHVLHTAGAGWAQGLAVFDAAMADVYANVHDILFLPPTQKQPRRSDEEQAIEVLCAYYEGLHASREQPNAIENFRREVLLEMGRP